MDRWWLEFPETPPPALSSIPYSFVVDWILPPETCCIVELTNTNKKNSQLPNNNAPSWVRMCLVMMNASGKVSKAAVCTLIMSWESQSSPTGSEMVGRSITNHTALASLIYLQPWCFVDWIENTHWSLILTFIYVQTKVFLNWGAGA